MSTEDDLRQAVDERLAARLETNRARRDGRVRRLAELAARRQAGLRARHRRKLLRPQETDRKEHTSE